MEVCHGIDPDYRCSGAAVWRELTPNGTRGSYFSAASSRVAQASVSSFGIGGLGASLSPLIARTHRCRVVASASFSLVHFGPKFLDLFPELVGVRLRGIVSVLLGMDTRGRSLCEHGAPPSRDGRPHNVWLLLHGGWRHEYDVLMLSGGVSQLPSTLAFLHTDFHTAANHSLEYCNAGSRTHAQKATDRQNSVWLLAVTCHEEVVNLADCLVRIVDDGATQNL